MKLNSRIDQEAAAYYQSEAEYKKAKANGTDMDAFYGLLSLIGFGIVLGLVMHVYYLLTVRLPEYLYTLFTIRIPEYFSALFFG